MSLNCAPVSAALFGLVSVKVNVEVPFTAMGFGAKDLEMVGGATPAGSLHAPHCWCSKLSES